MDSFPAIAFGIDLQLVPIGDGGTVAPLLNSADQAWVYRPNWGLPSMTPPDQTGAPVLAFSKDRVDPGDNAHAVIVTLFAKMVDQWSAEVELGAVLPMYEGARVCGHGTVLWRQHVTLPLGENDERRFFRWLRNPTRPLDND